LPIGDIDFDIGLVGTYSLSAFITFVHFDHWTAIYDPISHFRPWLPFEDGPH
jgi:hypothetical protein